MIKQYKKKPIVIEAIQLTIHNVNEVLRFMYPNHQYPKTDYEQEKFQDYKHLLNVDGLLIPTLEDGPDQQVKHFASIGDYIIKGVAGEFYPCKPDIFVKTYEEA